MIDTEHLWPRSAHVDDRGRLYVGGCELEELANIYGTPLYVFDEATFRWAAARYRESLRRHYRGEGVIHYACKAYLDGAVARIAVDEGLGLDVVSAGEVFVARHAGVPTEVMHLHGNAKPPAELEFAIAAGVSTIIVDTLDELALLGRLAVGRRINILLRVSPDIATRTHRFTQTGDARSKFGLAPEYLDEALALIAASGLQLVGLHCHVGSQISDLAPLVAAARSLLDLRDGIYHRHGIELAEIVPGGGLATVYRSTDEPSDIDRLVESIAKVIHDHCSASGRSLPKLTLEPGRSVIAQSMVAVYSVISRKRLPMNRGDDPVEQYVHVDGGIGDNIRPALYGARYSVCAPARMNDEPLEKVHISGRYCESSDVLVRDVALPRLAPGDRLALPMCGAYTLSMASNFNLTCRPPVVLVRDREHRIVQRREEFSDLVRRDIIKQESSAANMAAELLNSRP